ncbi:MAG: HIT family protein [Alphaproteobacteria bacterium]|nr:HIT family protein [Alphaproteobacteria bacterium]MDE1967490.1 HIT family protein [Alphaproteobacteria bacterium]MDE2513165.1 HIT family protein [Alphaproteobacteria bacterium]
MGVDPNCIFCKIVAGQIPSFRLFEDVASLAFMDINPANEGHCLVIAKPHHPTLYDMPPDLLAAVSATVLKVAKAVEAALKPDGLNLVQSNGKGAAQSVPHFHVHVLPRRLGDNLKINWEPKPGDRAAIAAVAERIKAKL